MSESGRDALGDLRKRSGGPPGCSRVVGMLSGICGRGREVLSDVREWSGGPPGCPGVVGRPSRMYE